MYQARILLEKHAESQLLETKLENSICGQSVSEMKQKLDKGAKVTEIFNSNESVGNRALYATNGFERRKYLKGRFDDIFKNIFSL